LMDAPPSHSGARGVVGLAPLADQDEKQLPSKRDAPAAHYPRGQSSHNGFSVHLTFSISRGVAWRGTGLPVPVPRLPWPLRAGPVTGHARRLHAAVRRRMLHSNSTGGILRQGRPEVKRFFSRPAERNPLGRRTGPEIVESFAGSPSYLPRKHSGRGTLDDCATTPQWCSWCRRTSTARGSGGEAVVFNARCSGRTRPAEMNSPNGFSSI
jgi:hypothetical protein